jgi:hypothetical protein
MRLSGATVRRWENNRLVPDEGDIARIAEAAGLSPQQTAFLSLACTRTRVMPPPDEREFKAYMGGLLQATPHPAMVLDSLFYVRAWNSYMDAVAPGSSRSFADGSHTITRMLRAGPDVLLRPDDRQDLLRLGLRIFWMNTALYCHRPEYGRLIDHLAEQPRFRDMWLDLALRSDLTEEPITFVHSIAGARAAFRVYSRTILFPPHYFLHEYFPDDDRAAQRLTRMREDGPPRVYFHRRLHWVADCAAGEAQSARGVT